MNAVIAEQLENMHRMLHKTHEEVKTLTGVVQNLHYALGSIGGDVPPPTSAAPAVLDSDEDDYEILKSKNIEICSREAIEILKVSDATLKRWRSYRLIDFRYVSANHISYKLIDFYIGIKQGNLKCKGLSSIDALERILVYAKNVRQLRSM